MKKTAKNSTKNDVTDAHAIAIVNAANEFCGTVASLVRSAKKEIGKQYKAVAVAVAGQPFSKIADEDLAKVKKSTNAAIKLAGKDFDITDGTLRTYLYEAAKAAGFPIDKSKAKARKKSKGNEKGKGTGAVKNPEPIPVEKMTDEQMQFVLENWMTDGKKSADDILAILNKACENVAQRAAA